MAAARRSSQRHRVAPCVQRGAIAKTPDLFTSSRISDSKTSCRHRAQASAPQPADMMTDYMLVERATVAISTPNPEFHQ